MSPHTKALIARAQQVRAQALSVHRSTVEVIRYTRTMRYMRSGMQYMPDIIKYKRCLLDASIKKEHGSGVEKLAHLKLALQMDAERALPQSLPALELATVWSGTAL